MVSWIPTYFSSLFVVKKGLAALLLVCVYQKEQILSILWIDFDFFVVDCWKQMFSYCPQHLHLIHYGGRLRKCASIDSQWSPKCVRCNLLGLLRMDFKALLDLF